MQRPTFPMTPNVQEEQPVPLFESSPVRTHSDLACEPCRRRKAKCDRILPSCMVCARTLQTCTYPSKRLKPGPKIGSSQRGRKRVRFNGSRSRQNPEVEEDDGGADDSMDNYEPITQIETSSSFRTEDFQRSTTTAAELRGCRRTSTSGSYADFGASQNYMPPSPQATDATEEATAEASDSSNTSTNGFLKAMSLASIIHPTHETCIPTPASDDDPYTSGFFVNLAGAQDLIMQSCRALSISIETLQSLIDSYFANMTSFSLFHQPSFGSKIQNIKTPLHLKALFAAMFSFSARFRPRFPYEGNNFTQNPLDNVDHQRFHNLALKFVDEAMDDCSDETPPLCLLQALILTTFYKLTNGVRGRAWRLLGSCVRIAYELRLHLIDYERPEGSPKTGPELARWSSDEERRRSWWAIWEMDTFASTIRRSPTAIDWTMNETYLPVKDEFWFSHHHHSSCFLEKKPMDRWKSLEKSRNESPEAWFIVVNSLMRDAQLLSNLRSILPDIDPNNNVAQLIQYFRNEYRKKQPEEEAEKLTILTHSLRCFTMALPESLAYKGEYLSFASMDSSSFSTAECKRNHCARYSIYLMIQLARFMIYHHYAFGEIIAGTILMDKPKNPGFGWTVMEQGKPTNCQGLLNCMEAADNILEILNRCSENHIQHVNPFLASTVWLATALQVLRKVFGDDSNPDLIESKCEVLRINCQQFTKFWGTPLALMENLDSLEERLKLRRTYPTVTAKPTNKPDGMNSTSKTPAYGDERLGSQEDTEWSTLPQKSYSLSTDAAATQSISAGRYYDTFPCASGGPASAPVNGREINSVEIHHSASVSAGSESMNDHMLNDLDLNLGLEDNFSWYLQGLMNESYARS